MKRSPNRSGYALIAVIGITIVVFLVASAAVSACYRLRKENRVLAEHLTARAAERE